MGTAGGEPRVLLNALKPMLGVVGEIKTPQEVIRVVGMMKDAEKLMSRCIYLNILKATCKQALRNDAKKETLHKFLASGGWGILNKWLLEFMDSENFSVLLELIDVLKILPVTVDILKQGNTGKVMKSMTKLEHVAVKKSASELIKQWYAMIKVKHVKKTDNEVKGEEKREIADSTGTRKVKREKNMKEKFAIAKSKKATSESSGFMASLNINPPAQKKRRVASMPLDDLLRGSAVEEQERDEKEEDPGKQHQEEEESAVEAVHEAMAEDTEKYDVVVDEGSIARRKNKTKRNISWAPDDQLVRVKYIESIKRKGVLNENFTQSRQLELLFEKQTMRAAQQEDTGLVEWSELLLVDNAGVPTLISGERSKEKFIQAEREKIVSARIYLSKQSIPNAPAEPDPLDPRKKKRTHETPIIPQTMLPSDEEESIPKSTQHSLLNTAGTAERSSSVSINSTSVFESSPILSVGNEPETPISAVNKIMSLLQQQQQRSIPPTTTQQQQRSIPPTTIQQRSIPPTTTKQQQRSIQPTTTQQQRSIPPTTTQQQRNIPPTTTQQQQRSIPPTTTQQQQRSIPPTTTQPNVPVAPPSLLLMSTRPPVNLTRHDENNFNNSFVTAPPTVQTSSRVDAPASKIRGQGHRGGTGFHNNTAQDGGGGGSGGTDRWGEPPNRLQPANKWNAEWVDDKNHNDNINHNDHCHNTGSFRGRGRGQNAFGSDRGGEGHGFRHGGEKRAVGDLSWRSMADRGRGSFKNSRGHNDRGRGKNDRGRSNTDGRRKYSVNNEWNNDDSNWNNHSPRQDGGRSWDDGNYENNFNR